MKEVVNLLILLGLSVIGNILGGVYVNINLSKLNFDWKKLVTGIIKALCISFMFLILAFIVESIPNVTETIGIEPKALIVSAIIIYATKIAGHLMKIFGIKKEEVTIIPEKEVKIEEEKDADEEFVDI